MAAEFYDVVYTKQKTKKHKAFQSAVGTLAPGLTGKGRLFTVYCVDDTSGAPVPSTRPIDTCYVPTDHLGQLLVNLSDWETETDQHIIRVNGAFIPPHISAPAPQHAILPSHKGAAAVAPVAPYGAPGIGQVRVAVRKQFKPPSRVQPVVTLATEGPTNGGAVGRAAYPPPPTAAHVHGDPHAVRPHVQLNSVSLQLGRGKRSATDVLSGAEKYATVEDVDNTAGPVQGRAALQGGVPQPMPVAAPPPTALKHGKQLVSLPWQVPAPTPAPTVWAPSLGAAHVTPPALLAHHPVQRAAGVGTGSGPRPFPPHARSAPQAAPPAAVFPPPEVCLAHMRGPWAFTCATCATHVRGAGSNGAPPSHTRTCASCYWAPLPFPDGPYPSVHAYANALGQASLQDIHMQIGGAASRYWRAYLQVAPGGGAFLPALLPGPATPSASTPAGWAGLQRACRLAGLAFYGSADLIRTRRMDADERARREAEAERSKAAKKAEAKRRRTGRSGGGEDGEEGEGVGVSAHSSSARRAVRQAMSLADAATLLEEGEVAVSPPQVVGEGESPVLALPHSHRLFLRVDKGDVERLGGVWSKGDLWVISTSAAFGYTGFGAGEGFPQSPPPPLTRQGHQGGSSGGAFFSAVQANTPFTFLARSAYYAMGSTGMMLLQPLCGVFGAGVLGQGGSVVTAPGLAAALAATGVWPAPTSAGPPCVRVVAMRLPDVSMITDGPGLATLAALRAMPRSLPLLPCLLAGPKPVLGAGSGSIQPPPAPPFLLPHTTRGALDALASSHIAAFGLNAGQAQVLRSAAAWFTAADECTRAPSPPLLLLHGVFGSGKSHTLVAVLCMLCRILDEAEAHTLPATGGQGLRLGPTAACVARPVGANVDDIVDENDEPHIAEREDEDEDEEGYTEAPDPLPLAGDSDGGLFDQEPDYERHEEEVKVVGSKHHPRKRKRAAGLGGPLAAQPNTMETSTAKSRVSPRTRILVAAGTNVAVDRILTDLLAHTQGQGQGQGPAFSRVGSARRVSPALLPYLLPSSLTPEAGAAAARELEGMLAERQGRDKGVGVDQAVVMGAIGRLRRTADCIAHLSATRIVAATCAACAFPVLDRLSFPIVILDECSQLPELTTLLPVARFGAARLLAVGDPQQLPPIHASPPVPTPTPVGARVHHLPPPPTLESSTLFERLGRLGWPVLRLCVQYRCPPALSALASALFYGGTIEDGRRGAPAGILPGMPALAVYDYSGWTPAGSPSVAPLGPRLEPRVEPCMEEKVDGGGSVYNEFEAGVAARLVRVALEGGTAAGDIGVICLYRAQTWRVRTALEQTCTVGVGEGEGEVQVSTVDAFQGQEKAVIVVCTSRTRLAGASAGIGQGHGHVEDARRLCVTLTRARAHCFIVGCARALAVHAVWARILEAAYAGGGYMDCRLAQSQSLLRPLAAMPLPAHAQVHGCSAPSQTTVVRPMVQAPNAVQQSADTEQLHVQTPMPGPTARPVVGTATQTRIAAAPALALVLSSTPVITTALAPALVSAGDDELL